MNNNLKMLDWITLFSFGIGLYALYIAFANLEENRDQNDELKQIMTSLYQLVESAVLDVQQTYVDEMKKNEDLYFSF